MNGMAWAKWGTLALGCAVITSGCVIKSGDDDDDFPGFAGADSGGGFSNGDDSGGSGGTTSTAGSGGSQASGGTQASAGSGAGTAGTDTTPATQTVAIMRQTEIDAVCMECLEGSSDLSDEAVTNTWNDCDAALTCGEEAARYVACRRDAATIVPDCDLGSEAGCCQDYVVSSLRADWGDEDYVYRDTPSDEFLDFLDSAVPMVIFNNDNTIADDSPPSCDLDCL